MADVTFVGTKKKHRYFELSATVLNFIFCRIYRLDPLLRKIDYLTSFVNSVLCFSLPLFVLLTGTDYLFDFVLTILAVMVYSGFALANGFVFHRYSAEQTLLSSVVSASIQLMLFAGQTIVFFLIAIASGLSAHGSESGSMMKIQYVLFLPMNYFLMYFFSIALSIAIRGFKNSRR